MRTTLLTAASALVFWAALLPTGQAQACGDPPKSALVAEYTTDITVEDLTNSRGVRLTDYRQILQQDRFNAHEHGLVEGVFLDNGRFDPFDLDTFFTNRDRRALIAQADYSRNCSDNLNRLIPQIESGRLQGFLYVRAYRAPSGGLLLFLNLVG